MAFFFEGAFRRPPKPRGLKRGGTLKGGGGIFRGGGYKGGIKNLKNQRAQTPLTQGGKGDWIGAPGGIFCRFFPPPKKKLGSNLGGQ